MTLAVHRSVADFRAAANAVRSAGKRLGLVPTMGALHEGHLSLVRAALQRADSVAVTIFVNPTQFGPNEDFERYPRTLEQDVELLTKAGASHVFAPEANEMYPPGERTRVSVSGLTASLCGPFRPGHFDGVTTIVSKLFAVAGECVAVFGRKDYQQLKVIERLARDLLLPVQVLGEPTVRDADGLALSSRNRFLQAAERAEAPILAKALNRVRDAVLAGNRDFASIEKEAVESLAQRGWQPDYIAVRRRVDLLPPGPADTATPLVVLAAAKLGTTRLIDNLEI
jgi:pantoate--beta-alanine ligase